SRHRHLPDRVRREAGGRVDPQRAAQAGRGPEPWPVPARLQDGDRQMDRDAEPDKARMNRETNVLMLLAAGGYLWRAAEREMIPEGPPLREAEFAVQWMSEHPSADDNERFEKLARATFWTVESLSSLALPPDVAAANGDATLDFGFEAVAEFACDQEGLDATDVLVGAEGM